jgi:hypothetical protein
MATHLAGDWISHNDLHSVAFEVRTGVAEVLALALVRGPLMVGAAAAAAPDLERVLPLPRPGRRKLFPSHRFAGWHQEGGLPVWIQLPVVPEVRG